MKTSIPEQIGRTSDGRRMTEILQTCVHCGMCNATCPTYQQRGDELDGPRGRIYLIKSFLEGETVTKKTQLHLDRCLTCRSCETTCPSGVEYGHLVELARPRVEKIVGRGRLERLKRWLIRHIVPYPKRFSALLILGRLVKPVLPSRLAEMLPQRSTLEFSATSQHPRTMLLLEGCAQSVVAPSINAATRQVFDHLGIALAAPTGVGCCGAVAYHLGDKSGAEQQARINIDKWWAQIEQGAEAIVVPSSGCAAMIADYPVLFADDQSYLARAKEVARLVCDPSQKLDAHQLATAFKPVSEQNRIAFQAPCSMQHSTHADQSVRNCLTAVGYELTAVAEEYLCCGSAGSYSLLQPDLATNLLERKLINLRKGQPEVIVSANIGCMMHLSRRSTTPVKHWLELLAEQIKTHA